MQGTVKFFHAERGFGFITPDKGEDVFVHVSNLHPAANATLNDGQTVEFEIGQGRRGDEARNVRPI
ncbi:MAG: cold shock domain-containing protein [Ilumatobacteraceae bacterium]